MKSKLNVGLLTHDDIQSAFMESIQDRLNRRCTNVDVNGRYNEMKEAILEAAEEHLKGDRKEDRTETYKALRKQVRRAVTGDKEKWLDGVHRVIITDPKNGNKMAGRVDSIPCTKEL